MPRRLIEPAVERTGCSVRRAGLGSNPLRKLTLGTIARGRDPGACILATMRRGVGVALLVLGLAIGVSACSSTPTQKTSAQVHKLATTTTSSSSTTTTTSPPTTATTTTTTLPPTTTTTAPPPTTAPPAAAPTGCTPLSDEGTCYEPGEYCRDDDHGVTGTAGDGETITCENNDGVAMGANMIRSWATGSLIAVAVVLTATSPALASSGHHKSKLAGMGATPAEMKAAHGVSYIKGGLCSAAPHCFGPGMHNNEGFTYLFTADTFQDGVLTDYTQAFPTNTSAATAESEILRWLPSDAHMGAITILHKGGSCAVYTITSATLAKVFSAHPKIQDPNGVIAVEMQYVNSNGNDVYNPSNVEDATLDAGEGPTVTMPNGSVLPSPYPALNPSVGCT